MICVGGDWSSGLGSASMEEEEEEEDEDSRRDWVFCQVCRWVEKALLLWRFHGSRNERSWQTFQSVV